MSHQDDTEASNARARELCNRAAADERQAICEWLRKYWFRGGFSEQIANEIERGAHRQ